MNTKDLTDAALDYAVAVCLGHKDIVTHYVAYIRIRDAAGHSLTFCPSTHWAHGGPIIEREEVFLSPRVEGNWSAAIYTADGFCHLYEGDTPLIAAMRCYVASRLGDEVTIPEELQR